MPIWKVSKPHQKRSSVVTNGSERMLRLNRLPHHQHHRRGGGAAGGVGGGISSGIIAIAQQRLRLITTTLLCFLLPMTMTSVANAYSILDVLKLTGTTPATCPSECTLCSCLDPITSSSSTTTTTTTTTTSRSKLMEECTQSQSIKACQTQTLDKCFSQLLFTTTGAAATTMKDNVDIAGLCAIQCPTTPDATRLGTVVQCRLCDIFTCCGSCPTNMADQCFPPSTTTTTGGGGGYTPSGWTPLVCEDTTADGSSGGKSSSNVLKEGVVVGLCLALILLLLPW
jgi:hypothetical protein